MISPPRSGEAAVNGDRSDQRARRRRGEGDGDYVECAVDAAQFLEVNGEGEAQQEGEEDLYAGLGDARLLKDLLPSSALRAPSRGDGYVFPETGFAR